MSTILWQGVIFGPIHSRRLGTSLGINLLPSDGKVCNFDCIYCECGWNRDRRATAVPSYETVCDEMDKKLSELHSEGVKIDTITFSGNGEPTLHPHFPEIIDFTLQVRDRYFPETLVSVLSNATTIHDERIRTALMKVDNPILKLDSADPDYLALMNRPTGNYSLESVIEDLGKFDGNFILQTMFLKGDVDGHHIDCTDAALCEMWRKMVLELRPREVMMYTIDRETPATGLRKVTRQEMQLISVPLTEAGIKVQIRE